jgi:hypothetical protein
MISPFIIKLYCKNRKLGYYVLAGLTLVTCLIPFTLAMIYDLPPGIVVTNIDDSSMDMVYTKPWCRFSPYGVGAMFGLMFYEMRNAEKLGNTFSSWIFYILGRSTLASWISLLSGVGLLTFLVFIRTPNNFLGVSNWGTFLNSLYVGFSRALYTIGLSLILLPMFSNQCKGIAKFLGAEIFAVLAKITFMAYLFHIFIVLYFNMDNYNSWYVSNLNLVVWSIGSFSITYIFSVGFSMMFESPFMNIERVFTG